ncbi:MAG: clostripain-related cysteine peptidase [Maricaulaceae bacterium]|jgi:hypothetical protein
MTDVWPVQICVFGAGDAARTGSFASLEPFLRRQLRDLSRVATNQHVAALAQLDSDTSPGIRWVMDPHGRTGFEELGEINTGDPAELLKFSQWAMRTCPAERQILVLSGHGLAFQDDVTRRYLGMSSRAPVEPSAPVRMRRPLFNEPIQARAILMDQDDFVDMKELEQVLATIAGQFQSNRLDAIVFDACLMSNIEVLFEIAPYVDTAIGSMDELSGGGFNLAGATEELTSMLRNGDPVTNGATAQAFVSAFEPAAATDSIVATDLAPYRERAIVEGFSEYCQAVRDRIDEEPEAATTMKGVFADASSRTERYKSQSISDLAHLHEYTAAAFGEDDPVARTLENVIKSVKRSIVGRKAGSAYRAAVGVSAFTPENAQQLSKMERSYRSLRFPRETGWFDLLGQIYA